MSELTRASLSGGTCCCMAVPEKVPNTAEPAPQQKAAAATQWAAAADEDDPGYRPTADAPVIHVRGLAYKGAVEITTRPPERAALHR